MKHKRRPIIFLILLILVSILLTSCDNEPISNGGKDINKADLSKKSWQDKDGLIRIWEKDDDYYIHYDKEKWEEKFDMEELLKEYGENASFADRELELWGIEEKVKDVTFASIDGYGGSHVLQNDYPLILMLMDSGKVMWMHGYPPIDEVFDNGEEFIRDEQYIYGYLPFIKDIKEFAYRAETEGRGDMTLFAVDKDGLSYDVRYLIDFEALVYGKWITAPAFSYGGEYDYIYLDFKEDGTIGMYKYKDNENMELYYKGRYEAHMDDSSSKGYRSPSISIDVKLANSKPKNYPADESFKGTFLLSLIDDYVINFHWTDGDSFEAGFDVFKFLLNEHEGEHQTSEDDSNIWYLTDGAFMDYFLYVMPDVKEKIRGESMALLIDGDYIELGDYGYCRNVSLGTNHDGSFVREVHYTVSKFGIVFRYDALDDLWHIDYSPSG